MRFYNKSLNQMSKSDLLEAFIEFHQGKAIDYPNDSPELKEKEIKYCLTVITAPEAGEIQLNAAWTEALAPFLALNNTYERAARLFYSIYDNPDCGHKFFYKVIEDVLHHFQLQPQKKSFLKYLINAKMPPANGTTLQTPNIKLEISEVQINYQGEVKSLEPLQINILKTLAKNAPNMVEISILETDTKTLQTSISNIRKTLGKEGIMTHYEKSEESGQKRAIGYSLVLQPSEISMTSACVTTKEK